MLSIPHYVVLWCILFTLIGAVWYVLDRRYGVKLYRRWYDLTHKDPLHEGTERGFVYNRSTKARVTAAWVVSTLQSLAVILTSPVNPLVELIMWILEVPVTLLGFYLGPYAYRLWQRRDSMFEAVDRIERRVERGEVDVTETAKAASGRILERVRSVFKAEEVPRASIADPAAEDTPATESPAVEEPANESGEKPRDLVRSYARKRQSR